AEAALGVGNVVEHRGDDGLPAVVLAGLARAVLVAPVARVLLAERLREPLAHQVRVEPAAEPSPDLGVHGTGGRAGVDERADGVEEDRANARGNAIRHPRRGLVAI